LPDPIAAGGRSYGLPVVDVLETGKRSHPEERDPV